MHELDKVPQDELEQLEKLIEVRVHHGTLTTTNMIDSCGCVVCVVTGGEKSGEFLHLEGPLRPEFAATFASTSHSVGPLGACCELWM